MIDLRRNRRIPADGYIALRDLTAIFADGQLCGITRIRVRIFHANGKRDRAANYAICRRILNNQTPIAHVPSTRQPDMHRRGKRIRAQRLGNIMNLSVAQHNSAGKLAARHAAEGFLQTSEKLCTAARFSN